LDVLKDDNHELSFIIRPYLIPPQSLIEFEANEKRKPVRVKEPIRFNIQPMPSKINFKIQLDENKDQALLGDFYDVYVVMAPEDITITEMSL
jgi:hypothetical protein